MTIISKNKKALLLLEDANAFRRKIDLIWNKTAIAKTNDVHTEIVRHILWINSIKLCSFFFIKSVSCVKYFCFSHFLKTIDDRINLLLFLRVWKQVAKEKKDFCKNKNFDISLTVSDIFMGKQVTIAMKLQSLFFIIGNSFWKSGEISLRLFFQKTSDKQTNHVFKKVLRIFKNLKIFHKNNIFFYFLSKAIFVKRTGNKNETIFRKHKKLKQEWI